MLNWIKKSIVLIILCAACLTGSVALAAEAKIKIPDLQVKIPGLENSFSTDNRGDWIGIYIAGIYKYAVGIIGILAAVILMVAGLMWLTAGGNTSQVQSAQEWIKAALTGMILALTSYVILFTINPDLVKFRSLNIQTVKQTPTTTEGTSSSARELSSNVTLDGEELTDEQAQLLLNNDIQLKDGVNLYGVRPDTVKGINELQISLEEEPLVITSGTEGDHATGQTYSHQNGYKVDLRDSSEFRQFVMDISDVETREIKVGAVYHTAYYVNFLGENDDTLYWYRFLDEENHWDVRVTLQRKMP